MSYFGQEFLTKTGIYNSFFNKIYMKNATIIPEQQGLYDPINEHDACGVGLVVNINGEKSHSIVVKKGYKYSKTWYTEELKGLRKIPVTVPEY